MVNIPTRQVETEWGVLYADNWRNGVVLFSSTSPKAGEPDLYLTINRLQYACDVWLSLRKPNTGGRLHLDDTRHAANRAAWSLRRHPSGAPPTRNAERALLRHVIPRLDDWLYSPQGALLVHKVNKAMDPQRAERVIRHASVEHLLETALAHVRRLEAPFVAGRSIDPADEEFLRYLTAEFRKATEQDTGLVAPDRPPRRPRPAAPATPEPDTRDRLAAIHAALARVDHAASPTTTHPRPFVPSARVGS
jgi:hypothetical protein